MSRAQKDTSLRTSEGSEVNVSRGNWKGKTILRLGEADRQAFGGETPGDGIE